MLNIVIPMAGAGSRFAVAGYERPKPLIEIDGREMIELVIKNLTPARPHRFIFICQDEHLLKFGLREKLESWAPQSRVIGITGITDGAACTVLKAEELINTEDPLMIANSDQLMDYSIDDYLMAADNSRYDGFIMCMSANDPKWSYIKRDDSGRVIDVLEKNVVSSEATVGIYNFKRGRDFVRAAHSSIEQKLATNGEYYVAPTYKVLIDEGAHVETLSIGSDTDRMIGLGTPHDLDIFMSKDRSERIANLWL